jgi:hypothetical protein
MDIVCGSGGEQQITQQPICPSANQYGFACGKRRNAK